MGRGEGLRLPQPPLFGCCPVPHPQPHGDGWLLAVYRSWLHSPSTHWIFPFSHLYRIARAHPDCLIREGAAQRQQAPPDQTTSRFGIWGLLPGKGVAHLRCSRAPQRPQVTEEVSVCTRPWTPKRVEASSSCQAPDFVACKEGKKTQ